jgi:hypothetical protein
MVIHGKAEVQNERKRQRSLIRDIFVAIDEDGSGTLEVDELIKALLSLCLSQDITFAKQIIYLFEEQYILRESKEDPKCRIQGERIFRSREERGEPSYSYKDFLKLFKKDPIGENIITVMENEIILMKKKKAVKKAKKKHSLAEQELKQQTEKE